MTTTTASMGGRALGSTPKRSSGSPARKTELLETGVATVPHREAGESVGEKFGTFERGYQPALMGKDRPLSKPAAADLKTAWPDTQR